MVRIIPPCSFFDFSSSEGFEMDAVQPLMKAALMELMNNRFEIG